MQEHGDRKKENSNGRPDEDQADQGSRRENLRFLQRGPLVDVNSRPGNLNRHLEHVPTAAVADDISASRASTSAWDNGFPLPPYQTRKATYNAAKTTATRIDPIVMVMFASRVCASMPIGAPQRQPEHQRGQRQDELITERSIPAMLPAPPSGASK